MSPWLLAVAALVLGLGAMLQSAVGFGMGLVSVPLLVWAGLPLPEAVSALLGATLVQLCLNAWGVRREIHWREGLPIVAVRWLFMPLGVLAMRELVQAGPATVRQVIGACLLALLLLRQWIRPAPRSQVPFGWAALAASSSGFLVGLAGLGGPTLVLYAQAHDWQPNRFRAFLWTQFLMGLPVAMGVLLAGMGLDLLRWFAFGALLTPVVWLGVYAGTRLTRAWSSARLRPVVTCCLYLIAVSSILGPLLSG